MYNVDYRDYTTTFHPCIYVFVRDFQPLFTFFSGFIMTFTIYLILLKNKIIPLQYKLFLGIIFSYILINSIIHRIYYKIRLNYPKDKNAILYKYLTIF
jgi:hypothetical protein